MTYKTEIMDEGPELYHELDVAMHERVCLHTPHGTIYLDIRPEDINSFHLKGLARQEDVVVLTRSAEA